MKLVKESLINEEKLFTFRNYNMELDCFKNPASVSQMDPWARAFHDITGDFYIVSSADGDESGDNDGSVTHDDFKFKIMEKTGADIKMDWDGSGSRNWEKGIAWQRHKNTKNWYLSESYENLTPEVIRELQEMLDQPKFHKPFGAIFILESIANQSY
jgi:hypothetical protein